MANEVEIVVTSKDKSGPGFKSATKATEEYAGALDRTGESADKGEQRILGAKDAVDGVATIMQGPGQQGIAAYLQGWADLASGVANFAVPAVQAVKQMTLSNLAAAKAAAGQKVAAAASKAWAVAQGALNAVMSANPVLLVVLAVAALVAGIVIAYRHSEKFRAVVQLLWRALKDGARTAISIVLTILDKLLGGFSTLLRAMGHLPGPLGKPFRTAADAIDKARGKLRGLQDDINNTKGKTVTVNVDTVYRSFDLGGGRRRRGVGQQAHGGIVGAAGGGPRSRLTMVGEHGRELVDLPPGSRVRSNPDTERLLAGAGAGGTVVLEVRSGGSKLDDLLVEVLRKAVRVRGGRGPNSVQLALGGA